MLPTRARRYRSLPENHPTAVRPIISSAGDMSDPSQCRPLNHLGCPRRPKLPRLLPLAWPCVPCPFCLEGYLLRSVELTSSIGPVKQSSRCQTAAWRYQTRRPARCTRCAAHAHRFGFRWSHPPRPQACSGSGRRSSSRPTAPTCTSRSARRTRQTRQRNVQGAVRFLGPRGRDEPRQGRAGRSQGKGR